MVSSELAEAWPCAHHTNAGHMACCHVNRSGPSLVTHPGPIVLQLLWSDESMELSAMPTAATCPTCCAAAAKGHMHIFVASPDPHALCFVSVAAAV